MGFGQTVEQDPDRIKWDLNKWQNRFMTKKDGVWAGYEWQNRIGQKKMHI